MRNRNIGLMLVALIIVSASVGYAVPLMNGHRTRPTYNELVAFLEADKTNEMPYSRAAYICINFARDLWYNAQHADLNMTFIVANIRAQTPIDAFPVGHAFNSITLANGFTVYIEPQDDGIFASPESLMFTMLSPDFPRVTVTIETMAIIW